TVPQAIDGSLDLERDIVRQPGDHVVAFGDAPVLHQGGHLDASHRRLWGHQLALLLEPAGSPGDNSYHRAACLAAGLAVPADSARDLSTTLRNAELVRAELKQHAGRRYAANLVRLQTQGEMLIAVLLREYAERRVQVSQVVVDHFREVRSVIVDLTHQVVQELLSHHERYIGRG